MPIYKGDQVTVNGKIVAGEIDESDEVEMPFKAGDELTVTGVKYKFVKMRNGKAVYRKVAGGKKEPGKPAPTEKPEKPYSVDSTPTMTAADLPAGAILETDFVAGYMYVQGKKYQLMKPVKKVDGKYVYLPV